MPEPDWDVVVVGAGAAGLMAAIHSAERGRRTLLLEKNRKAGVKILMSGGTRCNLTHATDSRGIVDAFGRRQGRFLHSPLAALDPEQLVAWFEAEGVRTKVEPTGKIFPISDRATDVLEALLQRLRRSGSSLALSEPLLKLQTSNGLFDLTTAHRYLSARHVVIASGGKSYPGCGTTGDGYAWARQFGHTIVTPRPALTPVTTNDAWVRDLQGLTIPDVTVRVTRRDGSELARRRESFLFTHFGLSGPAVLDVSRAITEQAEPHLLDLRCDFLPSESAAAVDHWLAQEAVRQGRKQLVNVLDTKLPRRLSEAIVAGCHCGEQRMAELSKRLRSQVGGWIKDAAIHVSGTRGFKKAEVTAGGIDLDEIDSRDMQSKRQPGLFLIGEVLDLDGPIGGYNFQAAFSTGWLAGQYV